MTGTSIAPQIRRAIGDEKSPYRWPDTLLVSYINTAKNVVYGMRPDLASVTSVVGTTPANITKLQDDIAINTLAETAIIHYVSFLCFEGDAEHVANDALAKKHYDYFLREIT